MGKSDQAHDLSGIRYESGKDHSQDHIIILQSKWNPEITGPLAMGAREALLSAGVSPSNIILQKIPGSFELPSAAAIAFGNRPDLDAVICIGCVIQGETRHFEFINQAVAQGCVDVSLRFGKPVIFGVLTPDTHQQAVDRSGGRLGNKGNEAAVAALEMIDFQRESH